MKFRTHYLIQPKFQLIFSGILILVSFISALLVGIIIYKLIFANNALFVKYQLHTYPAFLALLERERRMVPLAWLVSFLSVTFFLFFTGLFLSHKIVGPIFAFNREMQKLGKGDFTARLNLRKRDEFKELKIPFNQWVESLQKMTQDDIVHITALIDGLTSLISQMKQKNIEEKEIFEVQKMIDSLKDLMAVKGKKLTAS